MSAAPTPAQSDQLFGKELWRPSPDRIAQTDYVRFATSVGLDPKELHRWSVDHPVAFWEQVWKFCDILGEMGATVFQRGDSMRADRFFPDAKLNLATNFLRHDGPGDAIVAYPDEGERQSISWDDLRTQVGACAAAIRADGVKPLDRVVAYLPHGIEAIIAMIATASLGAIFSTASPDFGVQGVLDRFSQITPIVLFGCTGYSYAGKSFDTTDRLAQIHAGLPTVTRVITLEDFGNYLAPHVGSPVPDDLYPYDQPWYVLYSSGTTGKPKCFVHRAGGVFIQHRKEHSLHCQIGAGDAVLYFTTTGWMMWNWLVTSLAAAATVVCVDGSPFHPNPSRLFDIVDREGVTLLGVGAKYIDSLRKEGLRPVDTHDLSSLRTICSTGSPLVAEGFQYVYEHIKSDVHLASISGGTDLVSCFVGGNPTLPVRAGEIQNEMLGMRVDVWNDRGESVRATPGQRGELVCTQSFPSMPLGFWGDDDQTKYSAAYFERYAARDVWAHGDFAAFTQPHPDAPSGFVIHGRSDATLNPGGVRIGTAEITRQVEHDSAIAESLVFGQDWNDDTRIVLLVRMVPGKMLTSEAIVSIKQRIRTNCSPRHVPALVLAVDDLPRTRSGKLTELAVADAVNGREVRNTEAMANPEALWAIAARPEFRQ
jgi:acetoacetyl-CoA synthetase